LIGRDLIQFSVDYVKQFLIGLEPTNNAVSMTTVPNWWSMSQKTRPYDIL